MDRKKLLAYCIEETKNGKDFDVLRKELEQLNLEEKYISEIIKYVSNQMINKALTVVKKGHKREYFRIGWFLLIAGAFITIASYTGIIDMGNSYIVFVGPIIIVGIALITRNRSNN